MDGGSGRKPTGRCSLPRSFQGTPQRRHNAWTRASSQTTSFVPRYSCSPSVVSLTLSWQTDFRIPLTLRLVIFPKLRFFPADDSGIQFDEWGLPVLNKATLQSTVP